MHGPTLRARSAGLVRWWVSTRGRSNAFAPAAVAAPQPLRPEFALAALIAIPASVYARAGGYDESLEGYGDKDMELGIRLARARVEAVTPPDVYALHVWHPTAGWERLALENERNLDTVPRKHGLGATSDEWADWSV